MPFDDAIRDRVILLAGKVAGIDCPNCECKTRDVELDAVNFTTISCPECNTTVLTEDQQSQLRQAGKL